MATAITLTVRVAFWVPYYLSAVAVFCNTFGREPDWERVNYWIGKGIRVQVD